METTTFDAKAWLAARTKPDPVLELEPTHDHRQAKARALAVLANTDPLVAAREAFDALAERNHNLLNDPNAAKSAIADQICLLEAVAAAYTLKAATERKPERARLLQGIATRASATIIAATLALHRIRQDEADAQAFDA